MAGLQANTCGAPVPGEAALPTPLLYTCSHPMPAHPALASSIRMTRRLARAVGNGFPLSGLGVALGAVAAAAWWLFAVPRQDYVLQLVCLLCLALLATAVAVTLGGTFGLWRGRRRWSLEAPEGRAVFEARRGVGEVARVPGMRWPLVDLAWQWEAPAGFDVTLVPSGNQRVERVRANRRAWVDQVSRRWRVEDAFGLARHVTVDTRPVRLQVLPWAGGLNLAVLLRVLAEGEDVPHPAGAPLGDRADMRRYGSADPLRLVLWKVYARTGQLMVRTPERALTPDLRVAAYLPATPHDEAAAGAARVAVESGVLGERWTLGTDGVPGVATSEEDALAFICRSGGVDGQASGVEAFVAEARSAGMKQLVLFCPPMVGEWLERTVRAAAGWPGKTLALVVVDAVAEETGATRAWHRVLKRSRPAAAGGHLDTVEVTRADLDAVVGPLSRAGVDVLVLERPGGRVFPMGGTAVRRAA